MHRKLLCLSSLILLTACGSTAGLIGNAVTNTPIVSLSSTSTDEKAEALAWDGYLFCARSFNATKASMPGPLKAQLRGLLDTAYPALKAAHSARLSANSATFAQQLALANQAISQAKLLIPPAQGH